MRIKSFDQIDQGLLRIGTLETGIATKEAEMNAEIQKIKDKYDKETSEQRAEKDELVNQIELLCHDNKTEFEKQRSKTFTHGTIGFATNPPKVLQLSKRWKVTETIAVIKKLLKGLYVRKIEKEEVDKEAVLRDYNRKGEDNKIILDDKKLASVGLRIEQDERFFVNINWESLASKMVS